MMLPYLRAWFGQNSECFMSLVYMSWLICRRIVQHVLGLSYVYTAIMIGKFVSIPMIFSNGTTLNITPSKINSINECLFIQVVYEWESITRRLPM